MIRLRYVIIPLLACAVLVVWVIAGSRYRFDRPVRKVDSLRSPIAVIGWSSDGISLADGRKVQLRGFKSLPTSSQALAEITKRGIEVTGDGSVYGLVRVHHWCGNDPVDEHIARVEISELLTFLEEGERADPAGSASKFRIHREMGFSEHGWDIGEFIQFETVGPILR
jgi:hypothetical protein